MGLIILSVVDAVRGRETDLHSLKVELLVELLVDVRDVAAARLVATVHLQFSPFNYSIIR